MPKFRYLAKNIQGGVVNAAKGLVEAQNEKFAAKVLKNKGLTPISISEVKPSLFSQITSGFVQKISINEITNFTRNVSTMLAAGLPLSDALAMLKVQSGEKMSKIIEDVLESVEGGGNFADALGRHPEIFSPVYLALVKSGETAGILDGVMKRLADNLEKQREFQGKVKGAMIYPVIVVGGMCLVGLIMMIFVIPKLTSLYKEFGAKLPGPTQVLISISSFLSKNIFLMILLAGVSLYVFNLVRKTAEGKMKIDLFILKIPLIGKLQEEVILAEITRTLGLLISAGVRIVDSLNIAAGASSNKVFEEGMFEAAKKVEKGFPLAQALASDENFPMIVSQLVAVGEETGKMDEVLAKISAFFESESDQVLKGLTTAIEPLIMILLGIGVGFLIIAVILPIYNLTSQF